MPFNHSILKDLIGVCVDCRSELSPIKPEGFKCRKCNRKFEISSDGIFQMDPKEKSHSLAAYESEVFQRWLKVWPTELKNWSIYRNSFFRFISMSGHRVAQKLLNEHAGDQRIIVDVGCGNGIFRELSNSDIYIGVDGSIDSLKELKIRHPDAIAIQADVTKLPFKKNCLSAVLCLHTLEHVYHIDEALVELKRVLSADGKLIFSIPTEGGWGWSLGRKLTTKPVLKRRYSLDAEELMKIEHINDASRVLRFLGWNFDVAKLVYFPFNFLKLISINASITGVAERNENIEI